jgi:hypothetical protein
MRQRYLIVAALLVVMLAGCQRSTGSMPAVSPSPGGPGSVTATSPATGSVGATPSASAPGTASLPLDVNTVDLAGLKVAVDASQSPPPVGEKWTLSGSRWLSIDLRATNSTDATLDAKVYAARPLLHDAKGRLVDFALASSGPSIGGGHWTLWYRVATDGGPFTLSWTVGPGRFVVFHLR